MRNDGNMLSRSWGQVLKCISQLDMLHMIRSRDGNNEMIDDYSEDPAHFNEVMQSAVNHESVQTVTSQV